MHVAKAYHVMSLHVKSCWASYLADECVRAVAHCLAHRAKLRTHEDLHAPKKETSRMSTGENETRSACTTTGGEGEQNTACASLHVYHKRPGFKEEPAQAHMHYCYGLQPTRCVNVSQIPSFPVTCLRASVLEKCRQEKYCQPCSALLLPYWGVGAT